MCGCGKASVSAGGAVVAAAAAKTNPRWRVQFPSGSLKTYLSETEARIAAATVNGSVLLAPS